MRKVPLTVAVLAMNERAKATPTQPGIADDGLVARDEAFEDALRAFHWETFRAGVCYERDEWPTNDEEWADLDRSIQSEAVGEHFEGWRDDILDRITNQAAEITRLRAELAERNGQIERARSAATPIMRARIVEELLAAQSECRRRLSEALWPPTPNPPTFRTQSEGAGE